MRLVLPALIISLVNLLTIKYCKSIDTLSINIPNRPPAWVFSVVWSILYITTGMAWKNTKNDVMFTTILILCCLWMPIYTCINDRKLAAGVLLCLTIVTWNLTYDLNDKNRYLVLPLALWSTYALYLNLQSLKLK